MPDGRDIFFAAIQTTRMPMIVTDPRQQDNPIVFANNAFVQMAGYERREVIGRNCRFLQGPETDRDTVAAVREAIEARQEVAVEILNYRKDGSSFWNALFVSPVFDSDGTLVYFFASQLDVSRRRDAEEGLRQAQKMEALGQLTGGIAHDFNNLLQVVLGYVDVLRGMAGERGDARSLRAVSRIEEASRRGAVLTQQLLAFARKQQLDGRPVNLNQLVQTLSGMAERVLGEAVEIRHDLSPGLWTGRLDPVQAELALLNVLINARDAMRDGGTVTIRTANLEAGRPGEGGEFGDLPPGRYAVLSVSDNGEGMPQEVLSRVMEPFFTTKEEGKGSGLGLSMVYGFMKQSGGAVRIRSTVGQGTVVSLVFPVTEQEAAPGAAPRPARREDLAHGETILVVEDRAEVAELARLLLEDAGYGVLVAGNGREGLQRLEQAGRVDLLFTDLIMPGGMNGVALAREARRRRPHLKVLLTTGYAEAGMERQDVGSSGFELINKPYRRAELLRRVRQVLEGPTGVG
ncbi:histidine kinase famiy protein [Roseomonas gilardii subsp. gilardii]|nr:histidine kinase famiy protein [Roseomonas gilardii subsp. gilardii]